MSLEKLAVDTAFDTVRVTAITVKEIWSVLDAAAEKPAPSRYLSEKAIQAIQGLTDRAQRGIDAIAEEA